MSNKLLLIEDIDKLGRSGEIVKVKPGYARNYLIPRGLAVTATKGTLRMQERLQEERRQRAIQEKKEAETIASVLEGLLIETEAKVDHDGHMYGSVSAADIIDLIKKQHPAIALEKKSVMLKHPIKALGEHTIELRLKEEVKASIKLKVTAEGAPKEEAPVAQSD
jgi:large subunit ribosomal protein L9